jgi:hypothetical protein
MSSSSVDPGIARLLDAIGHGATASDSTAALLLRLVNRVGALERTARDHDLKLDKLSKQPRLPTGVDGRNGASDGPERGSALPPAPSAPRPTGPKGRVDSPKYPSRQRTIGWSHREDHEIEVARLIDRDWDR